MLAIRLDIRNHWVVVLVVVMAMAMVMVDGPLRDIQLI